MNKKNICVLYTGGTIGCAPDTESTLTPMDGGAFSSVLASLPELAGQCLAALPHIHYTLECFDTPLDSSDMTPAHWVDISLAVLARYEKYDGFVVLHGTDTLAWTASALSFLLPGLSKPVVLTGSQRPLIDAEEDARNNLIHALMLAGTSPIHEVCVCFDKLVLRGNRTVKIDAHQFAAFDSPNFPPLARIDEQGIHLEQSLLWPRAEQTLDDSAYRQQAIRRCQQIQSGVKLRAAATLYLFPGVQPHMLKNMLDPLLVPPIMGLVIAAYGTGNAPSDPAFLEAIRLAHQRGVVFVAITQTLQGEVEIDTYKTGAGLRQAGVISGVDMTPASALAKLALLVAQDLSQAQIETMMQTSLAGELTV